MQTIRQLILLLLLVLSWQAYGNERQTFVISHFEHPHMKRLKEVVTKAYNDLNIDVRFLPVTAERSMQMIEDGFVDAELIRNKQLYSPEGNSKVVYNLTQPDMNLFCKANEVCTEAVFSDPNAIIGAYQVHKKYLDLHYGDKIKAQILEIASLDQLIKLVEKGNLKHIALAVLYEEQLPKPFEAYHSRALFKIYGVHLLHKKHEALIPELSKALQKYMRAYPNKAF